MDYRPPKRILPVIVISQFFCTSLWFAGNAVLNDIIRTFGLDSRFLANLTSSVQFGFIAGTLVFAVFTIADRFSPSKVFFVSSILAALCNLGVIVNGMDHNALLIFRFLTGFFLAGIYPVGMKIASDHYQKGLGKSLGFLVGALVIGTSFPHLLKTVTTDLPFRVVFFFTSALAFLGGLCMVLIVPDGPHRKQSQKLNPVAFLKGYTNTNFRSASFGYFGHMWELYAFWAFVPMMITTFGLKYADFDVNIPLISFVVISVGGLSCAIGGLLSQRFGPGRIAVIALSASGLCCILSPLFLLGSSVFALIAFLIFWGMAVTADSPMFSTLVAQNSTVESRGSALTIMNCIGFTITIISIQLINVLMQYVRSELVFTFLAPGPVLGVIAMLRNKS